MPALKANAAELEKKFIIQSSKRPKGRCQKIPASPPFRPPDLLHYRGPRPQKRSDPGQGGKLGQRGAEHKAAPRFHRGAAVLYTGLFGGEHHAVSVGGGVDAVQGLEIAVDELGCDAVLQILLDLPAQIAGAVGGGEGLLHQVVQQGLVPGEGDAPLLQVVPQLAQHDGGDGLEVVLGELVEVDDLVHPVDELRPQEGFQGLHGPLPPLLVGGAAKAH